MSIGFIGAIVIGIGSVAETPEKIKKGLDSLDAMLPGAQG